MINCIFLKFEKRTRNHRFSCDQSLIIIVTITFPFWIVDWKSTSPCCFPIQRCCHSIVCKKHSGANYPSGAFGCKMSTEWQTHLKPLLWRFLIGIRNSDSFLRVKITPPLCSFKPLFFSLRLQFSNQFELSFIRVLLTQENCIFNSKYWGSFVVMYTSMKLRYNWYSKPLFLVYLFLNT